MTRENCNPVSFPVKNDADPSDPRRLADWAWAGEIAILDLGTARAPELALRPALSEPRDSAEIKFTIGVAESKTARVENKTLTLLDLAEDFAAAGRTVRPKTDQSLIMASPSRDGHHADASATAVSVLLLDADGCGDLTGLRKLLCEEGIAHIFSWSSSCDPTAGVHKYHVVIPLCVPVSLETKEEVWRHKRAYAFLAGALGKIAGLSGSLDVMMASPMQPFFRGMRKTEDAPQREVFHQGGRTLDLFAFVNALGFEKVVDRQENLQKVRSSKARAMTAALNVDASDKVQAAHRWMQAPEQTEVTGEGGGKFGGRDKALFRIASLLEQGFDLPTEMVRAMCYQWNLAYSDPPLPDYVIDEKCERLSGTNSNDDQRGFMIGAWRPKGLTTFPPGQYEVLASVLVQDGSIFKTTWTTVKDAARVKAGSRGEDIRRPTMIDGEAKFEGVAKALLAFFTVAMARELGKTQTMDPDLFVFNAEDPIGGPGYPVGGDEAERRAWIEAHKTQAGMWSIEELIEGGFCPTQSLILHVTVKDTFKTYTFALPTAKDEPTVVPALHVEQEKADREGASKVETERAQATIKPPALRGMEIELNDSEDIEQFVSRSELVERSLMALSAVPEVFVFGGKIAEVGGDDEISILDVPRLQSLLTGENATWIKWVKVPVAKQKSMITPVDKRPIKVEGPGRELCASVLATPVRVLKEQGLRVLDSITSAPQFTREGTVRTERGYDPVTRTYLTVDVDVEKPGESERAAVAAAKVLLSLVKDFPFQESARPRSRSIWLSCLLTRLCRSTIDGPCPMFTSTGNSAGVGKGLLWDLVSMIADGKDQPANTAWQSGERDLKDEVVSTLIASPSMARIDNIPPGKCLDSPTIASLLTSYPTYHARGKGERVQGVYQAKTVWTATGIDLSMSKELDMRALKIEIVTDRTNPDEQKLPNVVGMVREDRGKYLHAALTVLRAWHVAGRPEMDAPTMRSNFTAWSDTVRQCVLWLASLPGMEGVLTDPVARRETNTNYEEQDHARFVQIWHDLCQQMGDAKGVDVASQGLAPGAAIAPRDREGTYAYHAQTELIEFLKELDKAETSFLRKYLNSITGRNFVSAKDGVVRRITRTKTGLYRVQPVKMPDLEPTPPAPAPPAPAPAPVKTPTPAQTAPEPGPVKTKDLEPVKVPVLITPQIVPTPAQEPAKTPTPAESPPAVRERPGEALANDLDHAPDFCEPTPADKAKALLDGVKRRGKIKIRAGS